MRIEDAKASAVAAIDAASDSLRTVSLALHGNPELAYEERHAHAVLTEWLEGSGFLVKRGAYGLETAFEAVAGSGGPTIALFCEYDALPGIGHACGHNLIAIAGIAAGMAASRALGEGNGTVAVLGSPAEEGGGGKIRLIERGALNRIDAAMMVHPAPNDSAWFNSTATARFDVTYHGKNAHAGASPWEGINALDALIAAFNSMALVRQQIKPTDRINAIITNGGQAVNVIPDRTQAQVGIRVSRRSELPRLREKVVACFEGAAAATGCRLELVESTGYADMTTNEPMAVAFMENMAALGRAFPAPERARRAPSGGATDMGDVSYVVPSIHPAFAIPTSPGALNHTPGFTANAATPEAHADALRAAKGLANTAIDLCLRPDLLRAARDEFAKRT